MIGQENIRNKLLNLYSNNKLPRVIILNAQEGYGKKELVKWFSETTKIPYRLFTKSEDKTIIDLDQVQEAINDSINEYTKVIYVFENIEDNYKVQNALLKFLEEPPVNLIIFILCKNSNLLFNTIKNRGINIYFEQYTREELTNFNNNELALELFDTPKTLLDSKNIDINKLLETTDKIVDKLDLAYISNSLKLSSLIDKDTKDSYDINMFIKALKYSYYKKYKETKDDIYKDKFFNLEKALTNIRNNSKYFMDNFIIDNYMRLNKWK